MTCVNRGMMILLDHATALVQRQNDTNGIMFWIDTLADAESIAIVPSLLAALLYMEYCPTSSFTCYPRTLDSVCLPIIGLAQVQRFSAVAIFRSLLLLQQHQKFMEDFFEYMHINICGSDKYWYPLYLQAAKWLAMTGLEPAHNATGLEPAMFRSEFWCIIHYATRCSTIELHGR